LKLKCTDHHRRVISGAGHFIHRTGDGTVCNSDFASIGDSVYTFVRDKTGYTLGLIKRGGFYVVE